MKKLILGICASPRKNANTDFLLEEALKEAEKSPWVKTEKIDLSDYNINMCIGCVACCNEPGKETDNPCPAFKDGMQELYPKLKECDAIIMATPVYFGSMTAQLKAFMDRTEGLLRYGSSSYQNALNNKIGAGIAVGGNRNGGQEFTLLAIQYYYLVQGMTVVGTGPDMTPGCYLGGAGTTSPHRGKVKTAVHEDELGIKSCHILGRKVAAMLEE